MFPPRKNHFANRFQVGLGKIPKSEMMKLTHRYGWKFVCGCDPPAEDIDCGLRNNVGEPPRKNFAAA
jgi:hypothetical protein